MSYWEERQKELYKQLEEDEEKLKKRMSDYYKKESKKLENNISSYYAKYGKDNIIEYRKLMETLSNEDVSLLMEQMDEFAIKYPQYAHLMPIRESIYKLNRLEGLQTSIKMQQLEMGAIENKELTKHLTKQAQRGANATMETLGFGKNFYAINSDVVKSIVGIKYASGKNFSDFIWGNADKLANYLNTDVAQAFARGDSYARIMKHMKERFENVSRNDMYRLIYTEGTHIMAESTVRPFEEDYEEYKVSTAGDSKVCPICRGISDKVFKIKERVAGVNFPPFHTWCRCSFKIHVEDWDKWLDNYEEKHTDGNSSFIAKNVNKEYNLIEKNYHNPIKFNLNNDAAFNKWKNNYYQINKKSNFNKKDLKSMETYGGGSYEAINASQRFKKGSEQYVSICKKYGVENLDKYAKLSEELDLAVSKFKNNESISLHRYVSNVDYIIGDTTTLENMQSAIGKTFTEKGFTSTSILPEVTSHFTGGSKAGVHIEILAPEGVNGGFIQDYVEHTGEYEFLLNRNTKFEIVDAIETTKTVKRWDFVDRKYKNEKEKEYILKLKVVN